MDYYIFIYLDDKSAIFVSEGLLEREYELGHSEALTATYG